MVQQRKNLLRKLAVVLYTQTAHGAFNLLRRVHFHTTTLQHNCQTRYTRKRDHAIDGSRAEYRKSLSTRHVYSHPRVTTAPLRKA